MKITNKKEGISLIVLVITIIILAILAAVVITSITEANIINQATNATEAAHMADLKEQVELIKQEALIDENLNNGEGLDRERLLEILSQKFPGSVLYTYKISIDNGKYDITVSDNLSINVSKPTVLAKHPEQEDDNDDVGIAEDGSLVNLSLWDYTFINETNTWILRDTFSSSYICPYDINKLVDGKIDTKMPAYIASAAEGSVTSDDLIPVTSMAYSYAYNSSVKQISAIPSTVIDMNHTFYYCASLEVAPVIPASVTNMCETFRGCTGLTGTIRINSENVTNFEGCFYDITETLTVQVPAGSTTYDTLTAEYGTSGNITIETFN